MCFSGKTIDPPLMPAELLTRFLDERKMTPTELANRIKVPPNRMTGILHGLRGITAETALRLGRYFGTPPELWLQAQMALDLARTKERIGQCIQEQVHPEVQNG